MKKVLLIIVGIIVGLFVLAVAVGIINTTIQNDKAERTVNNATSQVTIESAPTVKWKGNIGGVDQTGQGNAALDVPNTGTDTNKTFKVAIQKTTAGKDPMTVILLVDGKESTRETVDAPDDELILETSVTLE